MKKVLDYLKSRPVEGENETAVHRNLSEALEIDVVRMKKIVAFLAKNRLITTSTFTRYSPITRSSKTGFAINPHYHKPSKPKPMKTPTANSSAQLFKIPTKTEEPRRSLKEYPRINGLDTTSDDTYIPRVHASKVGPCSCRAPIRRIPISDMRDGTRRILCKCTRCGHGWSEGSG